MEEIGLDGLEEFLLMSTYLNKLLVGEWVQIGLPNPGGSGMCSIRIAYQAVGNEGDRNDILQHYLQVDWGLSTPDGDKVHHAFAINASLIDNGDPINAIAAAIQLGKVEIARKYLLIFTQNTRPTQEQIDFVTSKMIFGV